MNNTIADWQRQFYALKGLDHDINVKMRKPGDWYVAGQMEISEPPFLKGEYGNGVTPEQAIENHWKIYSSGKTVKVGERYVKWNGFMWEDVKQ